MGQAQSQTTGSQAPKPRGPVTSVDPVAEAARIAEQRARAAAAAEARMNSQPKKKTSISAAQKAILHKKQQKGMSALEQASAENRGWRAADEAAEARRWD